VPVDPQLLEPWDRLIPIRITGRTHLVPENNTVLRVLQYLDVDLYPCRLCWNGDCDNCRFTYRDPQNGEEVSAKGCGTVVYEGMEIVSIPVKAVWPVSAGEAGRG
jgi:hypothetical protein